MKNTLEDWGLLIVGISAFLFFLSSTVNNSVQSMNGILIFRANVQRIEQQKQQAKDALLKQLIQKEKGNGRKN
jgi:hypothetical protein